VLLSTEGTELVRCVVVTLPLGVTRLGRQGPAGFSLAELLVALSLGLPLWGVVLQALVAEGRQVERLVRHVRERGQQRRVQALLRGDLQRATGWTWSWGPAPPAAWRAAIRCCSCRHPPARSSA
jgi:hypothetical protein